MLRRDLLSKALREPLLHFLLIGTAIFALSGLSEDEAVPDEPDRIIVTSGDIGRLAALWQKRWQRDPKAEELLGLVEDHVREEVLYRESLALGLDRDDTIIRRHLRRKFEFLTEDLAAGREPDAKEMTAYFEANRERYRMPARISFTQVYFNLDQRGAAGEPTARLVLADLREGLPLAEAQELGDGTLLARSYQDTAQPEIAALFGGNFATALSRLDIGSWAGPIASDYGLHLVRLDAWRKEEVPPLAEIGQQVRDDWAFEQRQQANETIYQRLRDRYEIVIEPSAEGATWQAGSEATR